MDELSIGLLLPSSGIRPMGKQYSKAFKKGLKEVLGDAASEIEIVPEMTGNGSPVQLEQAINKLFGYHGVNVVTGISSTYSLTAVADRFKKEGVPVICSNLGEHMLPIDGFNENVLLNSEGLWQQAWFMGNYAASEYGKKGIVVSAMYDSGYAFLISFQLGMQSFDADSIPFFHLLPLPPEGGLSDIDELFEKVDFNEFDYVMALFCGEEASMFLKKFKSEGLHKKVALFGLPFLLEKTEEDLSGIEVHTTLRAGYANMEDYTLDEVFVNLGLTAGRAIGQTIKDNDGEPTQEMLMKALEELDQSRTYDTQKPTNISGAISLIKNTYKEGNQLESEKVLEKIVDLEDDESITMARAGMSSSWVNPYLGI